MLGGFIDEICNSRRSGGSVSYQQAGNHDAFMLNKVDTFKCVQIMVVVSFNSLISYIIQL